MCTPCSARRGSRSTSTTAWPSALTAVWAGTTPWCGRGDRMKKLILGGLAAGVLALGLTVTAPAAQASGNYDFLTCLSNHNIAVYDTNAVLDLGERIQYDLYHGMPMSTIERNLIYRFNVPASIAPIDVQCAAAATLMGGAPGWGSESPPALPAPLGPPPGPGMEV